MDFTVIVDQCDIVLSEGWLWVLFFPMVMSWNILLNSAPRQWAGTQSISLDTGNLYFMSVLYRDSVNSDVCR